MAMRGIVLGRGRVYHKYRYKENVLKIWSSSFRFVKVIRAVAVYVRMQVMMVATCFGAGVTPHS
jgi:hypothetical protein